MKRYITALFAVLALVMTARAEQVFMPYVVQLNVENNGNAYTANYKFENRPEITFIQDQMLVTVWEVHTSYQFSIDHVKSIVLVADEAGVNDVVGNEDTFTVAVTATEVTLSGMKAAEHVAVYDINGRQVAAATADADGCAVVAIDNLGAGVYVVSTSGGKSFKFIK